MYDCTVPLKICQHYKVKTIPKNKHEDNASLQQTAITDGDMPVGLNNALVLQS